MYKSVFPDGAKLIISNLKPVVYPNYFQELFPAVRCIFYCFGFSRYTSFSKAIKGCRCHQG